MTNDSEPENIRKAIKAIGKSKLPLNKALINVEKGYDAAAVHAEQAYLAADVMGSAPKRPLRYLIA